MPLVRGYWSLIDVFARDTSDAVIQKTTSTWNYVNGRWQRASNLNIDIKFVNAGADVFAFYKAHLQATHETPPTQGNSQRKVATLRWTSDSLWFHAVYVSGGKVWYTWTENYGDTWAPEVLISDYQHVASRPCIAIKNEYSPKALNGAMAYISYVDETEGAVVLKSRRVAVERPDLWYTMDVIPLVNPSITHPVVDAASYADRQYTMLVYEADSALNYSVYAYTQPLVAEEDNGQVPPAVVTFRDRVLEDGYVNWRGKRFQPSLPSIAHPWTCSGNLEFDIAWREGDLGNMRKKRVKITELPDTLVVNPPATLVPSNALLIAPHAGPSIASTCLQSSATSVIAYEFENRGTFPVPASIPSQGMSILGRTFMPVTSQYPGGSMTLPSGRPTPGNRVAITKNAPNQVMSSVTQVTQLPYSALVRPEPSINFSVVSGQYTIMASMNFVSGNNINVPHTATVRFPYSMPSSVRAILQTDGYYPSVSVGYKPLQIHCGPEVILPVSYASPSPINADNIQYNVLNTTQGFRKTSSLEVSEPMRELLIRKNDSSYALFGIVKPHVINASGDYTEITWDFAADSSETLWWKDLPASIRTTAFSVPTDGAFEYGTELFAASPADLDSSAIVRVQFRNATTDQVVQSTNIDMSAYPGDSAIYVLDRYDLSEIAGQAVYMCLDVADTTSVQSWEIQVITALDTVQQQKATVKGAPIPTRIILEQNTPNPFSPFTTIRFAIEEECQVDLLVYDQYGRRVKSLVSEYRPAGWHQTLFDSGALPNGVYYYRLNALNQSVTKRMLMMR